MDAVLHKLLETVGEMNLQEGDYLKGVNILKECFEKAQQPEVKFKVHEGTEKYEFIITPEVKFVLDKVKRISYFGPKNDEWEIVAIKKVRNKQIIMNFTHPYRFANYVEATIDIYNKTSYSLKLSDIETVYFDVKENCKVHKQKMRDEAEMNGGNADDDDDDCYYDFDCFVKNSIANFIKMMPGLND
jgi:hypothetical protein